MAKWMKRQFESMEATEYPVGPAFEALSSFFRGAVVLALDVSYSMEGEPLNAAKRGAEDFLSEAADGGYSVGLVLWHGAVAGHVELRRESHAALELLRTAEARWGTNVVPALKVAWSDLKDDPSGDRVIAIFGDGDLGDRERALEIAAQIRADGIRIITCGLGEDSADALGELADYEERRHASSDAIEQSIRELATGLRRISGISF
ncbi:vWA domain-containing protein [Schaalia cardiffensis]|uniref:vWA domain-containing protein n=1 Tax=Schaalia cardiffensis TaxID=181487 RepID=UPI001E425EE6|nr:vWA domain-containing protein [Schaalia cardiffensis]